MPEPPAQLAVDVEAAESVEEEVQWRPVLEAGTVM